MIGISTRRGATGDATLRAPTSGLAYAPVGQTLPASVPRMGRLRSAFEGKIKDEEPIGKLCEFVDILKLVAEKSFHNSHRHGSKQEEATLNILEPPTPRIPAAKRNPIDNDVVEGREERALMSAAWKSYASTVSGTTARGLSNWSTCGGAWRDRMVSRIVGMDLRWVLSSSRDITLDTEAAKRPSAWSRRARWRARVDCPTPG
ncbi:hypothetical protein FA13DRAFT_1717856 [Coprinellus micaceus]|uniref:Uncharacterized protein n=1 Tax=Coprinellus micaceus TaxID=71717 RepID=A0A4Y7SGY0_COPMI|nr:hypothetical protein FA13DRAFT_1717856 [Coprinellus micaceus]